MSLAGIKQRAAPYYRNLRGWCTDRKLLIIESDDWGGIRMPSREVYERCLAAGYPVDRTWYERYDSLLSEDDIELLFEVLSSVHDAQGHPAVVTANVIVGNPDFEAIAATGFESYCYEPITETFKRYPKHARCWSLWQDGRRAGVMLPQFHGREHLNVNMFMAGLRADDPDARFAFNNRMPGCIPKGTALGPNYYVRTTNFRSHNEKLAVLNAALEGLDLFESLFGFRSRTFIPTNYIWSSDFDTATHQVGVEAYQGRRKMIERRCDRPSFYIRRHLGERNMHGQTYLVRNAFFEPSQSSAPRMDAVDQCLRDIRAAFRMRKPAVISTHRINFCGFLDESNRDQNLVALRALLERALKEWPDLEFVSSVDLLDHLQASPSGSKRAA